jgi:hypothetical protein
MILRFNRDNAIDAINYIGQKVCRFGNTYDWFINGPYTVPLHSLYSINVLSDHPFEPNPFSSGTNPPSAKYLVVEIEENK